MVREICVVMPLRLGAHLCSIGNVQQYDNQVINLRCVPFLVHMSNLDKENKIFMVA